MKVLFWILPILLILNSECMSELHESITTEWFNIALNTLEDGKPYNFILFLAALPTTPQRQKLFKTACLVRLDCDNDKINYALAAAGFSCIGEHEQNLIETLDDQQSQDFLKKFQPREYKKIGRVFTPSCSQSDIDSYYRIVDTLLNKNLEKFSKRLIIYKIQDTNIKLHIRYLAEKTGNDFATAAYSSTPVLDTRLNHITPSTTNPHISAPAQPHPAAVKLAHIMSSTQNKK